jgi:hypothetical protein
MRRRCSPTDVLSPPADGTQLRPRRGSTASRSSICRMA